MRLARTMVVLCVLLLTGIAGAQGKEPPPLAKDVAAVIQWLGAQQPAKCTEKCFVLTKLTLDGSIASGALGFTLEGGVLAEHAVAVPLFGPPNKVRLEAVTDDGKPASIGFEGDHYFAVTSGKHFTIKGKLALDGDLALTIPGPINSLEADLTNGRVVEGSKLSGLASTTIHFDGGSDAAKPTEPTVFQLSRAFRVLRETAFEYRLVLRSGNDLGVVRLPLSLSEKVLEVAGSTGWKVEGSALVLPTAGRTASITITGTIAEAPKRLTPDARSSYEWWLLESDAEHRITASTSETSAKQVDSADSPIPRTQPTSRLFLAKRGELLDLSVQTLTSTDALAAVVRDHARTAVLTARGDWVIDEQLVYENNGVDHLLFTPAGRPIFLATDGGAERLMHRDTEAGQLMIALRKGMHTARVQSLSAAKIGALGGVLAVPVPDHPLTASRSAVQIGLPHHVHALAVLGGDRIVWLVGSENGIALLVAAIAAWLAASTRRDRALLGIALAGLWFISEGVFAATIAAMALAAAFRIVGRALAGRQRTFGRIAVIASAGLALLVLFSTGRSYDAASRYRTIDVPVAAQSPGGGEKKLEEKTANLESQVTASDESSVTGNWAAQGAANGVLRGVAPVALPLPSAAHWTGAARELVTRERPFTPRVVYVTTAALAPFGALWGLSILALLYTHRARLAAMRVRLRELLAPVAAPAPAE